MMQLAATSDVRHPVFIHARDYMYPSGVALLVLV